MKLFSGLDQVEMKSGIRLKYTKKPRKFEADSLWLGAHWMFYLPPRQEILSLLTNYLTPRLSGGTRESNQLENRFFGGAYFRISCMIFRYYPKIHFYTHFWNQKSRKKFLDTKKISFSKADFC